MPRRWQRLNVSIYALCAVKRASVPLYNPLVGVLVVHHRRTPDGSHRTALVYSYNIPVTPNGRLVGT